MFWWRLQQIKSIDWKVRTRAAELLGESGDRRAVEPLLVALEDKDRNVREAAAAALGKVGDEQAVQPLIRALADWTPDVRRAAVQSLGQIGNPNALEPILGFLGDDDPEMRSTAAKAIECLGKDRLTPAQRVACAVARKRWDEAASIGAAAVPQLISCLKDPRTNVRLGALDALLKIGDERAIEPVKSLLHDPQPETQEAAAWALGSFGDARAADSLLSRARSGNIAGIAVAALAQLLQRNPQGFADESLIEIAELQDRAPQARPPGTPQRGTIDYSRVRHLAEAELKRRKSGAGASTEPDPARRL